MEKVKTAVKLGSQTQQLKPLIDMAGVGVCGFSLFIFIQLKKAYYYEVRPLAQVVTTPIIFFI
jgi:hypothetical protein